MSGRAIVTFIGTALVLYTVYAALMVALHTRFIYPFFDRPLVADAFTARAVDGVTVYLNKAPEGAPVVLYFMGNAGSLELFQPMLDLHDEAGRQVVAMGYRGGGGLAGKPSETALKADALAVRDALPGLVGDRPVVVQGLSMGTGLALHVAANRAVEGVILAAPYTRMCRIMAARAALPACVLPSVQRWDNLALADRITAPVLILHGTGDRLIPFAHGRALAQALEKAGTAVDLVPIKGAGHTDLFAFEDYRAAIDRFSEAPENS